MAGTSLSIGTSSFTFLNLTPPQSHGPMVGLGETLQCKNCSWYQTSSYTSCEVCIWSEYKRP